MNEFDLNIGAQVFCSDGKCGSLAKVAVDPETRRVTHLIVEEGFLLKRSRVFPFSSVEVATSAEIRLLLRSDDLEQYPVYREETVEMPASNQGEAGASAFWREGVPYGVGPTVPVPVVSEKIRHGVADDLAVVDRSTPVEGLDGGIGKVDRFMVDAPSGEITQVIVQQGLLFTSKRAVPASMVTAIAEDAVFVEAGGEELKDLPEYPPKNYETQSAATHNDEESDNPGHASSDPEVDLATRVAMALFEDPRTSDAVIEVIDERGVITLDGEVDSEETREAANEIARAQPGVTSVVNLLRVER